MYVSQTFPGNLGEKKENIFYSRCERADTRPMQIRCDYIMDMLSGTWHYSSRL